MPKGSYIMKNKPSPATAVSAGLVSVTLLSTLALSSSLASADNDSVVDEINVTVPISCTMSGTGQDSHNATINNGQSSSAIGETTIKAFCNDTNGFAIYAIGYTDNTDGKNVLTNATLGDTYDIVTGTATGPVGNTDTSQWAMKLSTITSPVPTYPIIIAGSSTDTAREQGDPDFTSFQEVPDDYTKVAYRTSSTDINPQGQSTAEGSTIKSTYQAYISKTQPAGTYTGQVKYTLVHPHDEEAPPKNVITQANRISYNPNSRSVTDTMSDQEITDVAIEALLWSSNFRRPGYGFAGWNTKADYSGVNYGPNETISFEAGQYSQPNGGLSLYAIWVRSEGYLQDWDGCFSMEINQVTALTDLRDDNTYAIARLADGNCWMIENLRLESLNTLGDTNKSLAQGYGVDTTYGSFIGLANPETSTFRDNRTTANSIYYSGTQSGTASIDIGSNASTYPALRFPRYNNTNTIAPTDNMNSFDNETNVYSLGNYYTWAAAIANTRLYSSKVSENANTSICPRGWVLPKGDNVDRNGSYYHLNYALVSSSAYNSSDAFRKYPNNFILSGRIDSYDSSFNHRGSSGYYWTSSTNATNSAFTLYLNSLSSADVGTARYNKSNGYAVRCLMLAD